MISLLDNSPVFGYDRAMKTASKPIRHTVGYVTGSGGHFGRTPFFQIRLLKEDGANLDRLLTSDNKERRGTMTITVSFHQPDRLRITEVDPPEYERRAAQNYLRGDILRVQGREGVSCSLDLSMLWGVPAFQTGLRSAVQRAAEFIVFSVPSRKRNLVEFVADIDSPNTDSDLEALAHASMALAAQTLAVEDFSSWKK